MENKNIQILPKESVVHFFEEKSKVQSDVIYYRFVVEGEFTPEKKFQHGSNIYELQENTGVDFKDGQSIFSAMVYFDEKKEA